MTHTVRVEISKSGLSAEEAARATAIFQEAKAVALARFCSGAQATLELNYENVERFLLWKRPTGGLTAPSLAAKRQHLRSFVDYFGSRPLSLITAHDMAMWHYHVSGRAGKKRRYNTHYATLSADTIRKYLSDLRQFCAWARDIECAALPDLPCERFSVPARGKVRGNQYPPKVLSYPDFLYVLRRLHNRYPHVAAVIRGIFLLGARPAQLFALTWADIRLPREKHKGKHPGEVRLRACKGGIESSPPVEWGSSEHLLLRDCAEMFVRFRGRKPQKADYVFVTQWGRSRAWTPQSFADRLRDCCKKLQIKDFIAYIARHTAATLLQRNTSNLATVQATLQHRRVETQGVYTHRVSADALEGRKLLSGLMPSLKPVAPPLEEERKRKKKGVEPEDEPQGEDIPESEEFEGDFSAEELFDL